MTPPYEIHLGKSLQEAWNIFLRAPELYTVLTLAVLGLNYVFAHTPAGWLFSLFSIPLLFPAFFLFADMDARRGKADFSALRELTPFLPQLWLMNLISLVFITLGLIFFVIPGLYLATCYIFAPVMVIEEKKTFWEALEGSRKLVQQHWLAVFGLWIFSTLLYFAGLWLVGIGVLVSCPVSALMIYCAYRDIVRRPIVVE